MYNRVAEEKNPEEEDLSWLTDEELKEVLWLTYLNSYSFRNLKLAWDKLKEASPRLPLRTLFLPDLPNENALPPFDTFEEYADFIRNHMLTEQELKTFGLLKTKTTLSNILAQKENVRHEVLGHVDSSSSENTSALNDLLEILKTMEPLDIGLSFFLELFKKIQNKSKNEIVGFTPDYNPEQPDIRRMIQGNPDFYIKKIEAAQKNQKKKIIVHLADTGGYRVDIKQLLVNSDLFDLYVLNQGVITPLSNPKIPSDCISTDDLKKILNDSHENINDYYILDEDQLSKIPFHPTRPSQDTEYNIYLKHTDVNILAFLLNIKMVNIALNENGVASFCRSEFFLFAMNTLTQLEMLTLHISSSKDTFQTEKIMELPIQLAHLKKINFKFLRGDKPPSFSVNFDHAKSLEEISFKHVTLTDVIDFSKLNQLKYVKFMGTINLPGIKITPTQARSVIFDFAQTAISRELYKVISALRSAGVTVILNSTQEHELNILKREEEVKPSSFQHQNRLEQYNNDPSFLQSSEGNEVKQTNNLLNERGPIHASAYRKKMLTGIDIQNGRLVFTPYLFDKTQATSVPL